MHTMACLRPRRSDYHCRVLRVCASFMLQFFRAGVSIKCVQAIVTWGNVSVRSVLLERYPQNCSMKAPSVCCIFTFFRRLRGSRSRPYVLSPLMGLRASNRASFHCVRESRVFNRVFIHCLQEKLGENVSLTLAHGRVYWPQSFKTVQRDRQGCCVRRRIRTRTTHRRPHMKPSPPGQGVFYALIREAARRAPDGPRGRQGQVCTHSYT